MSLLGGLSLRSRAISVVSERSVQHGLEFPTCRERLVEGHATSHDCATATLTVELGGPLTWNAHRGAGKSDAAGMRRGAIRRHDLHSSGVKTLGFGLFSFGGSGS